MANPKGPPEKYRFKKGQSGNPEGGRTHNKAIKALKLLTIKEYRDVIQLALTSNLAALKALAENPNTTAVQVGVAIALAKAVQRGDWNVINAIAERIVGKLPDKLEVDNLNPGVVQTVIFNIPSNGREKKK